MSHIIADRIVETSNTIGTGAYILLGGVTGYRPASSECAYGDTFEYYAEDIDANGAVTGPWEIGTGTFGPGNILVRTTILKSTNSGLAVNWLAGTRRIAMAITSDTFTAITADFAQLATSLINTQILLVTYATT